MTDKTQENIQYFSAHGRHMTVCAQCGYRLMKSDTVLNVNETGDLIHKDCWVDYFDENLGLFACEMEF